jgi:hypothetical protein
MDRRKHLEQRLKVVTEGLRTSEPQDLVRIVSGIVSSNAGTKGQYFSTLVFLHGELRSIGFHGLMEIARLLEDETISVEVIRRFIILLMESRVGFLDYLGLQEMGELCREYLDLVRSATDVEVLRHPTELLSEYGLRMYWWFETMFPWELAAFKMRAKRENLEWLLGESVKPRAREYSFKGY